MKVGAALVKDQHAGQRGQPCWRGCPPGTAVTHQPWLGHCFLWGISSSDAHLWVSHSVQAAVLPPAPRAARGVSPCLGIQNLLGLQPRCILYLLRDEAVQSSTWLKGGCVLLHVHTAFSLRGRGTNAEKGAVLISLCCYWRAVMGSSLEIATKLAPLVPGARSARLLFALCTQLLGCILLWCQGRGDCTGAAVHKGVRCLVTCLP